MRIPHLVNAVRRARERLGLSTRGLLVVAFGVVALVSSFAVFGSATDDVTEHNGLATHDAVRLRSFTIHRSDLVVRLAKVVSTIGDPPVLAILGLLAGFLFWRRGVRLILALAPTIALGVSAVSVGVTKAIVGRARPPVALHLVHESDYSFPSGARPIAQPFASRSRSCSRSTWSGARSPASLRSSPAGCSRSRSGRVA